MCYVDSVSDCKKEVVKQVQLSNRSVFTYLFSLFTCDFVSIYRLQTGAVRLSAWTPLRNHSTQLTFCLSLPYSMTWYRPMRADALRPGR